MRKLALVVLVAALMLGCAPKEAGRPETPDASPAAKEQAPPQPLTPEEKAQLDSYRKEAEALIYEQMDMGWRNRVFGEPVDFASTYAGHEQLFSMPAVELAGRAAATDPDPETARAYDFFRIYLLAEMVNKEVAGLDDRITNAKVEATFVFDGRTYAFYEHSRMLRNEPDYDRRQQLSDAVLPIYETLNPLLAEKEQRSQELARELGYSGYVALSEDLRDADLSLLAARCEAFLDQTDDLYMKLLRKVTPKQLDFPAEQLRRCDLGRLLQNAQFEGRFPGDAMMPLMTRTLLGMGIDLLNMPNVTIDSEPREKKDPRAACYPMRVPSDVRLTIKPAGGGSDYGALFHEMGHTLHFAFTTTPVFELQQLGNNTVTETYAFLFDGLLEHPLFCRDEVGITGQDLAHYLQFAAFNKLMMARRYAAKVIYEIGLHQGDPDPRKSYRELLGRAYGIELDENDGMRYLIDVDDYFYSADYLRAWWLEAMLSQKLMERFGPDWYKKPEAAAYLQSLWASGNKMSGDELAKELGFDGIEPGPLLYKLDWITRFSDLGPAE